MKFRHSLHSRIIIAFCVFGTVLGAIFAVSVYISLDFIDDRLVDSRLNEEVENFKSHYKRYNNYPHPGSPFITSYVGTESMPLYVLDMIKGFPEGLHEVNYGEEEYHIAIQRLPDQPALVYLFYEVSALEFTERRKVSIRLVLIAGVILIFAMGLWIGWLTSRRVIAPVVHLSNIVDKSGPDNLPTDLSKSFYNDEVGVLAKGLEQAMKRVETFVEREQQFSRYASHELRTPVTIIKGAVVLLKKKLSGEEDPAWRPLMRIERSVTNMENIIETLLWLSREDMPIDQEQCFPLTPVVQETIEQNRYLIGNKPIDIEIISEAEPQLALPTSFFQIALTNLIRNAIQHTPSGKISVIVKADRVLVTDTGAGMTADGLKHTSGQQFTGATDEGFGLGLSIVKRLCNRFGWELDIESETDRGTTVQLIFRTP
jgi:signal transduction histidine kinase